MHIDLSGDSFCFLLVKKFVSFNDERNIKCDTTLDPLTEDMRSTIVDSSPSNSEICKNWGKCLQEDVQEEGLLEAKLGDKVTVLEEHQGEDKAPWMLRISKVVGWKLWDAFCLGFLGKPNMYVHLEVL